MRIAALYDIHGNLPALEAVLGDIRQAGIDRIVIGGDVIPGPMPAECLELLRSVDVPVEYIVGNGDRETVAARRGVMSDAIPTSFREAMRWNAEQLSDADADEIDRWPLTYRVIVEAGDILFCHATHRNDTEIFTAQTSVETLRPIFEPLDAQIVVCGHTHMQFDRTVGTKRIVNAGSVGMPFQAAGAYWLLLDSQIQLRRTEYDLQKAAASVRRTSYPQAEEFATNSILNPPSQQAMIDAFAKAELH